METPESRCVIDSVCVSEHGAQHCSTAGQPGTGWYCVFRLGHR